MKDPTEIYPLMLFVVTSLLWASTVFYSSRIFRTFRKQYPDVAAREIPFAFDTSAHPEKALFFFRRKAVEWLRRDPVLWPMRQRFVALTVLSLLIPPLGFLPGFIYAVIHTS
jgi:hypothetical protein